MQSELNSDVLELQQDSMRADHITHAFAVDCSPAVSATLELGIVNRRNGLPSPMFADILHGLPFPICGRARAGNSQSQIVYSTRRHDNVNSLRGELLEFISAADQVAQRRDAKLLWNGAFPIGGSTADDLTHGVHFQVSVPRAKAIKVVDRLQAYVPMLVGLSANSPILHGEMTGHSSHRAFIESNSVLSGLAGPFVNWQRFNEHVDKLRDLGRVESARDLNYFVRPTSIGMIELRCCDLPNGLDQVVVLAALIQTLVAALAEGELAFGINRDLLATELHEAIAKGIAAQLTDHTGDSVSPLQWLQRLRYDLEPVAVGLGTDCALALAGDVLADNGAALQMREWQASSGQDRSYKVRSARTPMPRVFEIAAATAAAGVAGLMAGLYLG